MDEKFEEIELLAYSKTTFYSKLNIVFGVLSTIGSTYLMINFFEGSLLLDNLINGSYSIHSSVDSNVIGMISFFASAFFYICACSLINLFINIYQQSFIANELKKLELTQK